MKNQFLFILSIAVVFGLASCTENAAPTITVHSPTSASPFMSGDTVHVHIDFADDEQLHEVAVTIVREHGDTTFFHAHDHPDATSASLHGDFVISTPMHSDFTVTAIATDHAGESTTDVSTIHCHPM